MTSTFKNQCERTMDRVKFSAHTSRPARRAFRINVAFVRPVATRNKVEVFGKLIRSVFTKSKNRSADGVLAVNEICKGIYPAV
jgi:hypothetical protein